MTHAGLDYFVILLRENKSPERKNKKVKKVNNVKKNEKYV
jgi:hypothetical protein